MLSDGECIRNLLDFMSCVIRIMNPLYFQGSKQNHKLYEINFVNHLLESLVEENKVPVIVVQSTF